MEIRVTGPDAPNDLLGKYNGLYYSAPAANIKSLTIRGTEDDEKITIDGDLGISGNIQVVGGGGHDELILNDANGTAREHRYTFGGTTQGWDQRINRAIEDVGGVINLVGAVDFKGIEKFTLNGSPGVDIVRVDDISQKVTEGLFINTKAGDDEITIGSPDTGFGPLLATISVDGGRDHSQVTYLDDKGAVARGYVLGLSDLDADGWDMRLGVAGAAYPVVHSKNVSKYELQATQFDDTIQIDATSKKATLGTFIFGNDGDDKITIGSVADGLTHVAKDVTVTGGEGLDQLVIDDRAQVVPGKYKVFPNKVTFDNKLTITNTDSLFRTVRTSKSNDFVYLYGNSDDPEAKLAVETNAGDDKIIVANAPGGPPDDLLGEVTIAGGLGDDSVTIESGTLEDPTMANIESLKNVGGTLLLGEELMVDGTFTQQANGIYTIRSLDTGSTGLLATTGIVTLAGKLEFAPATSFQQNSITLIDNQSKTPVVGIFVGLPEGSSVTVGGHEYILSYAGGTGNDVVLTAVSPPPPPPYIGVNDEFFSSTAPSFTGPNLMANDIGYNGTQTAVLGSDGNPFGYFTIEVNTDGSFTVFRLNPDISDCWFTYDVYDPILGTVVGGGFVHVTFLV